MKFKMGDRVKVSERLISKLANPKLISTLRSIGTVIEVHKHKTIEVKFPNNDSYVLSAYDLKLVIGQQLLFNFMG